MQQQYYGQPPQYYDEVARQHPHPPGMQQHYDPGMQQHYDPGMQQHYDQQQQYYNQHQQQQYEYATMYHQPPHSHHHNQHAMSHQQHSGGTSAPAPAPVEVTPPAVGATANVCAACRQRGISKCRHHGFKVKRPGGSLVASDSAAILEQRRPSPLFLSESHVVTTTSGLADVKKSEVYAHVNPHGKGLLDYIRCILDVTSTAMRDFCEAYEQHIDPDITKGITKDDDYKLDGKLDACE
jgi:hypothetical protein